MLMVVAAAALAILYFMRFDTLANLPKPENTSVFGMRKSWSLLGYGLCFNTIALLFWFMLWPNARMFLFVGICYLLLASVMAYFKDPNLFKQTSVLTRVVPAFVVVVAASMISPYSHVSAKYNADPEYRDAYINWLQQPGDSASYYNWHELHCRRHPLDCGYVE